MSDQAPVLHINQYGSYIEYTEPIDIEEDTVIQTYAEVNGERSYITMATCLYDNGIETPIISCNGEIVTIGCNQANAEIYYRINQIPRVGSLYWLHTPEYK